MEQPVERGKQWLEKLLALMAIPATVSTGNEPADSDSCWLTIDETNLTPKQIELLIGERGESIDAIQYLTNTLLNINLAPELQSSYTVEINSYRVKRHQELFDLAQKLARQVRETGKEVEITALSAAERRQIHTFLQDSIDIETESRGQEPDRRLVVKLR